MSKILATNILDFVVQKRANLLHLQTKQDAIRLHMNSKVAAPSADMSASAAAFVIDQQSAAISGLQHSLAQTMKVAAALAEAAKLAEDGMIDSSDVIDHARQALVEGTVKVSSLNDAFDLSPGQLSGTADNQSKESGKLDPLTTVLRRSNV